MKHPWSIGDTPVTRREFIRIAGLSSLSAMSLHFLNLSCSPADSTDTPPSAPSALSATALSSSSIRLTWVDNSPNESKFVIERSSDGSSFPWIVDVPKNTHVYISNGLSAETSYYYRAKSLNAAGESPYSNVCSTSTLAAGSGPSENTVYIVKNGDCFQNISRLWELMGGVASIIDPDDVVIIKANGQWPNQGYTHTGCIKAVIDEILSIPGFSGEILICDNVQTYAVAGQTGFDAGIPYRTNNYADCNWSGLTGTYQAVGKPVAIKRWYTSTGTISGPQDGIDGWMRDFFDFHGAQVYLSYPVFQSPLTPGRMIDMKYGVWEGGSAGNYTSRKVKTIVMPTLNNHGSGSAEDYAGVTSAIKSFFGATEIHNGAGGYFNGHRNIHCGSYSLGGSDGAYYAGELAARYISTMCAPVLYITAAMWSGHESRMDAATETKTVLACTNPATLDYIACRDVIGPYNSNLNPDNANNTRKQILGCINGGIGSITAYSTVIHDFDD